MTNAYDFLDLPQVYFQDMVNDERQRESRPHFRSGCFQIVAAIFAYRSPYLGNRLVASLMTFGILQHIFPVQNLFLIPMNPNFGYVA